MMNALLPGPRGRMLRRARTRPTINVAAAAVAWRVPDTCDSLIVPFGQLRGTLLCRHQLRDGRAPLLIRELLPTLDLRHGRCAWTGGPVVCDLSRTWYDLGDPLSIKPWQRNLIDAVAELRSVIDDAVGMAEPILPYTLAAIPPSAQIRPRPTKAIVQIAERAGEPWQSAWQRLARDRAVDSSDGLRWIDTRLCDRIRPGQTWPGAVALTHDLRDVPLVHVWRPPLSASVPESLFVYQPHAILDGWNAPESLMQRLGMEHFPSPMIADRPHLAMAG